MCRMAERNAAFAGWHLSLPAGSSVTNMEPNIDKPSEATLRTMPGDDVRQIMWRFSDRYDLQLLVQSARTVARGPVARLVANGGRNTHDWTPEKAALLQVFDDSGITAAFLDPEHGGHISGPKNLALALIAFELSWVDAGAATCSLAGNLGLAPIHERGTPEQRAEYLGRAAPGSSAVSGKPQVRAAFALTEPLPFVGVETGMLSGKVRVAEWPDGGEPILHVDKRGRFITNMAFANVVTAAVASDDPRIKGTCMVILEEGDDGVFDRGVATKKLVHQLSSTCDPVFNMRVPASRIVGGYTVKDGVIVPNFSHSEIIESVFRRTRVTVGLMTSAKLLSAIEPVILYQRRRFRGGDVAPGMPRYELGLQQKEDSLHRLVDIWATGEASASLGFAAARLFDELDPIEREKDRLFAERGLSGRSAFKELTKAQAEAIELVRLHSLPPDAQDKTRIAELESNPLVRFVMLDSLANVLCPACKLWNTGHGANMMREAVSLMGGYGVTEDCPGFLGQKWMDAQLEATYEGPEAVQRLQLSVTMTNELFLAQFEQWIADMRRIASERPGMGACVLATAMDLWLWTLKHVQSATDARGAKLFHKTRQGVTFALADALCWILAVRQFMLDVLELETKGKENPALADALPGLVTFFSDLAHVQAARAAGEVGRITSEIVYGYRAHGMHPDISRLCGCKSRDPDGIGGAGQQGVNSGTPNSGVAGLGWAGALPELGELTPFAELRLKLDLCLSGARLSKDRAAQALTAVMVPEALDYPA